MLARWDSCRSMIAFDARIFGDDDDRTLEPLSAIEAIQAELMPPQRA